MPHTEAHANGGEDANLTPREAVLKAIRDMAQEMAQVKSVRDFMDEGLLFLQKASNGAFCAGEVPLDDTAVLLEADDILLDTNIEITSIKDEDTFNTPVMRMIINDKGQILSNFPDPDAPPPVQFEPTDEQKAQATANAEHSAAQAGDTSDEYKQRIYDNCIEQYRQQAKLDAQQQNDIFSPTTKTEALTELATAAVLCGYVPSLPAADGGLTDAQKAVMDGLRKGFERQQVQIRLVEGAAAPFLAGLKFLATLSDGSLDVTHALSIDGGSLEIKTMALTLEPHTEPFMTQFLNIHANGRVQFDNNNYFYSEGQKYEAMNEADIRELLTTIAKLAVFAGKIPLTPDQIDTSSVEKKMIADAVRAAEAERAFARAAATDIEEGLNTLKAQLYGNFKFERGESTNAGDVIFTLNAWTPYKSTITVNGNGIISVGKDLYDAYDPAAVTAALTGITRTALSQIAQAGKTISYNYMPRGPRMMP